MLFTVVTVLTEGIFQCPLSASSREYLSIVRRIKARAGERGPASLPMEGGKDIFGDENGGKELRRRLYHIITPPFVCS